MGQHVVRELDEALTRYSGRGEIVGFSGPMQALHEGVKVEDLATDHSGAVSGGTNVRSDDVHTYQTPQRLDV
jgi:hypothetical protein